MGVTHSAFEMGRSNFLNVLLIAAYIARMLGPCEASTALR
jgi:hypothetical protein